MQSPEGGPRSHTEVPAPLHHDWGQVGQRLHSIAWRVSKEVLQVEAHHTTRHGGLAGVWGVRGCGGEEGGAKEGLSAEMSEQI